MLAIFVPLVIPVKRHKHHLNWKCNPQKALCYGYGIKRQFQQHFSYIVAVNLLVEEIGVHRPSASH